MIYKSYGKIKYDPISERSTFKPHWVILQCDREIVRYYQHVFYTLYFKKMQTAVWSSHVSILRGEKPNKPENWKLYNGRTIEFEYEFNGAAGFNTNGKHFWLKCRSPEFGKIRESLGLNPIPKIDFHLSIGSISL